jgi:hypothetical protein
MGEVVNMSLWKHRRAGIQPTRVYTAGNTAKTLVVATLESQLKTQRSILNTSGSVYERETAAIKIGELQIKLRNIKENGNG